MGPTRRKVVQIIVRDIQAVAACALFTPAESLKGIDPDLLLRVQRLYLDKRCFLVKSR